MCEPECECDVHSACGSGGAAGCTYRVSLINLLCVVSTSERCDGAKARRLRTNTLELVESLGAKTSQLRILIVAADQICIGDGAGCCWRLCSLRRFCRRHGSLYRQRLIHQWSHVTQSALDVVPLRCRLVALLVRSGPCTHAYSSFQELVDRVRARTRSRDKSAPITRAPRQATSQGRNRVRFWIRTGGSAPGVLAPRVPASVARAGRP